MHSTERRYLLLFLVFRNTVLEKTYPLMQSGLSHPTDNYNIPADSVLQGRQSKIKEISSASSVFKVKSDTW